METALKRQMGLFLAWLVSILAIVATQYASIVFILPVCQLCWYQRICIYPLAVVLGIGAFQNDARAVVYGIPLAALALFFSLYQYAEGIFPSLAFSHFCHLNSCRIVEPIWGWLSWPLLSAVASVLIIFLLLWSAQKESGR